MKQLIYDKQLFQPKPIGITDGRLSLVESTASIVDPLVEKYHYSHKATSNRFLSFLVNDRQGFLQLGYGIRPHIKYTVTELITTENYCEFDRMWLSDELPKNSESKIIGLLLSYIKQVYPQIQFIITYADGSVGNVGTIYRASNAIPIGSVPVDFYQTADGERIHPVSMWHRHGTRAIATLERLYPGIKHITSARQYRYLYVLNRGLRKQLKREMRGQGVKRDTLRYHRRKSGAVPDARFVEQGHLF